MINQEIVERLEGYTKDEIERLVLNKLNELDV